MPGKTATKKKAAPSPKGGGNPYHSLPSRSAKRRKTHWKVRHVSFKLYDEDAILVEQLADTSSFTNLCTNVFRSYHKAQQDFLKSGIPQLTGCPVEAAETELALIPMPAVLWDAYLKRAQELSSATGKDVGCEELMLQVLVQAIEAGQQLPKAAGQ